MDDAMNISSADGGTCDSALDKSALPSLAKENVASEIQEIFTLLRTQLSEDQVVKEEIHQTLESLEQAVRDVYTCLQAVHNPGNMTVLEICLKGNILLQIVSEKIMILRSTVPLESYYKYHMMWSSSFSRLTTCISLIHFLQNASLICQNEVANLLHLDTERGPNKFHLTIEDYLVGILHLASELSRLTVNSVIQGNYERPFIIFKFISELNSGFKLLHFKNDHLRKKYDSLKYDIRKIEEVVYDLTLRGLKPDSIDIK